MLSSVSGSQLSNPNAIGGVRRIHVLPCPLVPACWTLPMPVNLLRGSARVSRGRCMPGGGVLRRGCCMAARTQAAKHSTKGPGPPAGTSRGGGGSASGGGCGGAVSGGRMCAAARAGRRERCTGGGRGPDSAPTLAVAGDGASQRDGGGRRRRPTAGHRVSPPQRPLGTLRHRAVLDGRVGGRRAAPRCSTASRGAGDHAEQCAQAQQAPDPDEAVGATHDGFVADGTSARPGDRAVHEARRVWAPNLSRINTCETPSKNHSSH
jgi:hypothetical protein